MRTTSIAIILLAMATVCPAVAGEITIVGAGSGTAVLKSIAAAFTQSHPEITFDIPKSIGSRGAIKTVGRDEYMIGRVARPIWDKEKHFGLTHLPYAKVPIVFFTNQNVGIKALSTQQVCDIYGGKVRNWKAVGGKDAKIKVVRREEGDSSLGTLLKSFPGFDAITITPKSKTTLSDPITIQLVRKKADTIGFGTYANAKKYPVNILSINGKGPADSDYPYFSTLALVFKEKNKTGDLGKFVDFATSAAAHEAIRNGGGLPF